MSGAPTIAFTYGDELVDSLITGDATMAVFNVPNTLDVHPFLAVKSAYDMQLGAAEL